MCGGSKAPKTVAASTVTEKDLPVLRNPWLDGATSRGVASLRIDRRRAGSGTARQPGVTTPPVTPSSPPTTLPGVPTGGGYSPPITDGELVTRRPRDLMISRNEL